MTSDQLLYTSLSGERLALEDLIDEGLDGGYSDRYPALAQLLETGTPKERVHAAVLLVAWGRPEGFGQLRTWANDPEQVPRLGGPDRPSHLPDVAFELLADAIRASRFVTRDEHLAALQVEGTRALLRLYDREFFGRRLADMLRMEPELAALAEEEVRRAFRATMDRLGAGKSPAYLPMQAAALLGPLARLQDNEAAAGAQALLQAYGADLRVHREIAEALSAGTGRATLDLLEQWVAHPDSRVRDEARNALERRRRSK